MVSLDDAVIARLKKGEDRFEILVDPYLAADLLEGKEIDILQILAVDTVFYDSKKGLMLLMNPFKLFLEQIMWQKLQPKLLKKEIYNLQPNSVIKCRGIKEIVS